MLKKIHSFFSFFISLYKINAYTFSEKNKPFTRDKVAYNNYSIGIGTYGEPNILDYDGKTKLEIGCYCSIANNVKILLGGNHRTDWISTYPFSVFEQQFSNAKKVTGHPSSKGDIIIGHDVWIGDSAIILSGVTIGNGAVIAAASVITRNVGPYEIWAGNPAKLVKKRFTEEEISELLRIEWWNWNTERINSWLNQICSSNITSFIENNNR